MTCYLHYYYAREEIWPRLTCVRPVYLFIDEIEYHKPLMFSFEIRFDFNGNNFTLFTHSFHPINFVQSCQKKSYVIMFIYDCEYIIVEPEQVLIYVNEIYLHLCKKNIARSYIIIYLSNHCWILHKEAVFSAWYH